MIDQVRVAVIGVGNNISALVQGIALYRATGSLAGIRTPVLNELGVGDIEFVAAFAISPERICRDLTDAIFLPPNIFPRLTAELPLTGVTVRRGLTDAAEVERVATALSGAEVVLYAAPSGRRRRHCAYAQAALLAGVAFINTTSDSVARDRQWLDRFEAAGLPLAWRRPDQPVRHLSRASCPAAASEGAGTHPDKLVPGEPRRHRGLPEPCRARQHQAAVRTQRARRRRSRTGPGAGSTARVPAAAEVAQGGPHQHRGARPRPTPGEPRREAKGPRPAVAPE